jgi:hypothetical protein
MEVLRKAGDTPRPGGGAGIGRGLPPEPPRRRGPRPILVVLGAIALILAFLVGLEFSGSGPVQVAEEQATSGVAVPDAPVSGGRSEVAGRDSGEEAPAVPGRLAAAQMPATTAEARPEAKPVVAAEARPEAKPVVAAEAKPEAKPVVAAEAKPEAKPVVAAEAKPEAKPVVAAQENSGSQAAAPNSDPAANPTEAKTDPTASPTEVASDSTAMQAQAKADSRPPAPVAGMPAEEREALSVGSLQERRQTRRDAREDSRRESQRMRKAMQNAGSEEERQALIAKFREQRDTARAERRAEDAERRLRLEAQARSRAAVARPVEQNLAGTAEYVPAAGPLTTGGRLETAGASSGSGRPAVDAPDPDRKVLRRAPSGVPSVRINILQYSRDPDRRFAYMSLEGQPAMTQVREGESYQGLTVKRIFPDVVEFDHSGSLFLLRAN